MNDCVRTPRREGYALVFRLLYARGTTSTSDTGLALLYYGTLLAYSAACIYLNHYMYFLLFIILLYYVHII